MENKNDENKDKNKDNSEISEDSNIKNNQNKIEEISEDSNIKNKEEKKEIEITESLFNKTESVIPEESIITKSKLEKNDYG